MSGGVDSSVAAALLAEQGHDVTGRHAAAVGRRLRLRVLQRSATSRTPVASPAQLDVPHYVFNLADDFDRDVVDPYVAGYAAGRTPNPCVECNRSIKFGVLRAARSALGFDAVATGHHARVRRTSDGTLRAPTWYRPGEGPVLRALHARPAGARPGRCCRSASSRRRRSAPTLPGLGLRTADQAGEHGRLLHHARCDGARSSTSGSRRVPGAVLDTDGRTVGQHNGRGALHDRAATRPGPRGRRAPLRRRRRRREPRRSWSAPAPSSAAETSRCATRRWVTRAAADRSRARRADACARARGRGVRRR